MAAGSRTIGQRDVGAIGLGCMNINHAYGRPLAREDAARLLLHALDTGVRHFDTAAIYGATANEALVGEILGRRRDEYFLASKCGMTDLGGRRVIDGRPETIRATAEQALARLHTDHLDLYYLHRLDPAVPVEDSVGALAELVREGKIGGIGLSEVSAQTLRRAAAVHPIAAVQNEYSLWTRNPELGVLQAAQELGTAFVAFSPLGRGFLAGALRDPGTLHEADLRRGMPRFQGTNFAANLYLVEELELLARQAAVTPAQLALAWVLDQGSHVIALPGTTDTAHLTENMAAAHLDLPESVLRRAGHLINQHTVRGARYSDAAQADVDTEEFTAERAGR